MRLPFNYSRLSLVWTRWSLAALLIAAPATILSVRSFAAVRPTVENPHGKFKGDCALCHAAANWKPAKISTSFNHANFGFALTGAHATTKCMACHGSLDFSQSKQLCANCHQDPHRGEMGTACARCHSSRSFADRSAMVRAHQATRFPLSGSHAQIDCETCHKPTAQGKMQFVGTKAECQNCHMEQYRGAKNPDHVAGGMPTDCATCHTTLTWSTKNFDHNKTAFPLTGTHRSVACQSCHIANVFKGTNTACYSCHKKDYDGTTAPVHSVAAGYPTTCLQCHNTTSWMGAGFDHSKTLFPLTGAHLAAGCTCHSDGVYKGKSMLCYSCHVKDYGTTVVSHASAGFATTCENCHNTTLFNPGAFNHSTATTFPLTGAHSAQLCSGCHSDHIFKGKSTTCDNCHHARYTATTNPPHLATGFPAACETCHDTVVWTNGKFNHTTNTTFPLTGAHIAVGCNGCHGDGVYKGKSMLCITCHKTQYATPVVNHTLAGFATTCQNCHTTAAWNGGAFNHSTLTLFPLTGAHAAQMCNACHSTVFKGLSTTCDNCHHARYTATSNPPHLATGFPAACETCHDTVVWTNGKFNHSLNTTFPLTGAHLAVACNGCHGDGVYKGKSTLCITCHKTDFATPVVNHTLAGFATTCESCHTTTAWNPGAFKHATFQLTGAHISQLCSGCHTTIFKGLSTLCYSCHKTQYGTLVVNHVASGFPTTCETCHGTTVWTGAKFTHLLFPLTGAHTSVACLGCHGDGVYKGRSMLCYSCHKTDYATPVANHLAAGFGTACETCHTTAAWSGAKVPNHDTFFPIYSGRHTQALSGWNACSDCHPNAANYAVWACMSSGCHGGVPTSNADHRAQTSIGTKCLSCHPKGIAG